jgi:tRNA A37 threonylcarbamoyladenosine dehydratase
MNGSKSADGSAPNTQLCWVHTKWGRHQAKILMETLQEEGHYIIVQMINNAFQTEESIKVFKKNQIEYI